MAKKDRLEWFGADVEEDAATTTTEVQFHGGRFVDAEVPRNVRNPETGEVETKLVRKPAPKYLRAKTTSPTDHEIGRLTARYKTMREGFRFAPDAEKDEWERRMDIAFAEMQIARFKQKLARYESEPNPRPEQVQLYRNTINQWRGRFAELTGQA